MVEPSSKLSETAGVCLEEALINASNDDLAYLVLSNTNGVSCQIDENTCIDVVHEAALVDPGTQSAQVQDGPTMSRVEAGGPDRGLNTNQKIQKLLTTVKKYLYANRVRIYTNHSAVKAVLLAPNPSGKHARWWTRVYG